MPLKSFIVAIYTVLTFGVLSYAQNSPSEQHVEAALRLIGHEVLIKANDTTSRILPVTKENNRYKVTFDTTFTFEPDQLVRTIDSIVRQTKIANSYMVEMQDCSSYETIYSFKVDAIEKEDIVPCQGRLQPKACYNLLFTIISPINEAQLITQVVESKTQLSTILYYSLGILLLILLAYLFIRKARSKTDPDLISLGAFVFDKRNTELILENQRIELTHKEADLLLLLYNKANTTVERDEILHKIWEDEGHYVGRTLDVFISKLRKKLELDTKVKIVNIRGVGYKLVVN